MPNSYNVIPDSSENSSIRLTHIKMINLTNILRANTKVKEEVII